MVKEVIRQEFELKNVDETRNYHINDKSKTQII